MNVKLVVVGGDSNAQEVPLKKLPTTVGRDAGVDLRIVHSQVSRKHCEFVCHQGRLMLRDLKSSNGTFVRGHKIKEAFLKAGDEVKIGPVTFRVEASPSKKSDDKKKAASAKNPAAPPAAKPALPDDLKDTAEFTPLAPDAFPQEAAPAETVAETPMFAEPAVEPMMFDEPPAEAAPAAESPPATSAEAEVDFFASLVGDAAESAAESPMPAELIADEPEAPAWPDLAATQAFAPPPAEAPSAPAAEPEPPAAAEEADFFANLAEDAAPAAEAPLFAEPVAEAPAVDFAADEPVAETPAAAEPVADAWPMADEALAAEPHQEPGELPAVEPVAEFPLADEAPAATTDDDPFAAWLNQAAPAAEAPAPEIPEAAIAEPAAPVAEPAAASDEDFFAMLAGGEAVPAVEELPASESGPVAEFPPVEFPPAEVPHDELMAFEPVAELPVADSVSLPDDAPVAESPVEPTAESSDDPFAAWMAEQPAAAGEGATDETAMFEPQPVEPAREAESVDVDQPWGFVAEAPSAEPPFVAEDQHESQTTAPSDDATYAWSPGVGGVDALPSSAEQAAAEPEDAWFVDVEGAPAASAPPTAEPTADLNAATEMWAPAEASSESNSLWDEAAAEAEPMFADTPAESDEIAVAPAPTSSAPSAPPAIDWPAPDAFEPAADAPPSLSPAPAMFDAPAAPSEWAAPIAAAAAAAPAMMAAATASSDTPSTSAKKVKRSWWPFGRKKETPADDPAAAPVSRAASIHETAGSIPLADAPLSGAALSGAAMSAGGIAATWGAESPTAAPRPRKPLTAAQQVALVNMPSGAVDTLDVFFPPILTAPVDRPVVEPEPAVESVAEPAVAVAAAAVAAAEVAELAAADEPAAAEPSDSFAEASESLGLAEIAPAGDSPDATEMWNPGAEIPAAPADSFEEANPWDHLAAEPLPAAEEQSDENLADWLQDDAAAPAADLPEANQWAPAAELPEIAATPAADEPEAWLPVADAPAPEPMFDDLVGEQPAAPAEPAAFDPLLDNLADELPVAHALTAPESAEPSDIPMLADDELGPVDPVAPSPTAAESELDDDLQNFLASDLSAPPPPAAGIEDDDEWLATVMPSDEPAAPQAELPADLGNAAESPIDFGDEEDLPLLADDDESADAAANDLPAGMPPEASLPNEPAAPTSDKPTAADDDDALADFLRDLGR